MPIIKFAPPKINLNLHIHGKRPDGYHLLESIVVFGQPESGDCIIYDHNRAYGLCVEGEFAHDTPNDESNLILKIAKLAQSTFNDIHIGHFTLIKNLPVASGLGGGTMDAIIALKCLQEIYHFHNEACLDLASQIGADGTICWHQKPLIMRGIGEQVELIPWTETLHIVLINPKQSLETARVFRQFSLTSNTPFPQLNPIEPPYDILNPFAHHRNDLLPSATSLCPEIARILDYLKSSKADYVNMSGSGATCFGIFRSENAAHMALANTPRHWWSFETAIHSMLEI